MIPDVDGVVNVGAVTTPATHTAWTTAGATGVTSEHDAAANVARPRRRSRIDTLPRRG